MLLLCRRDLSAKVAAAGEKGLLVIRNGIQQVAADKKTIAKHGCTTGSRGPLARSSSTEKSLSLFVRKNI
ncbi:hypothetical protein T01_15349 [Trichinella spiralis]|uniref:Uncharacterized protein n=1 Tax=Trichinella spiralis TaxID=6334 RepID=A0A0V1BE79_TRISP|nr:hypothetical protein T01_15349 [Trichinella spiralis]